VSTFPVSSRVFGLDLLRTYAIFCVVHGHGHALLWPFVSSAVFRLPTVDGVSVFFVLSGFLIGRILLRTWNASGLGLNGMIDFWVRRWFRTLPTYALVLSLILLIWVIDRRPLPEGWPKYLVFAQNLNWPHPDFFPEAWSLAVEEWFYLLMPLGLVLAGAIGLSRRSSALVVILGVIVAVTLFRIQRAHGLEPLDVHAWDVLLKKQVVTRFDSLMYGVLGAYLSFHRPHQWRRHRLSCLAIGIALLLTEKILTAHGGSSPYLAYLSLSVLPLGTLMLLPFLSSWRLRGRAGPVAGIITTLSLTSYSMYLVHFTIVLNLIVPPISAGLSASGVAPMPVALLCYLAYWSLSLGCAYLLWRYFEAPMTCLRERFRFGTSLRERSSAER
jgi:peptidoglycan/LPS O-acetylase OafA/YrhL